MTTKLADTIKIYNEIPFEDQRNKLCSSLSWITEELQVGWDALSPSLRGENYGGDIERSTSPATASDVNAFIVGAHAATWVQTSVVRRRAAGQMPRGATCYPVAPCDDHNSA